MSTATATEVDLRAIEAEARIQIATTLGIDSKYVEFDVYEDAVDPAYYYASLDVTVPLTEAQRTKLSRWLQEYGGITIAPFEA